MFCGKCGNQIEDGLKFCPKCGSQIGEDEQQSYSYQMNNAVPGGDNSGNGIGKTDGGKSIFPWIAGGLFIVTVLLYFIPFYGVSVLGVINIIAYLIIAFGLFTKRRDVITAGGFAIVTIVKLISFFAGFATYSYKVYSWSWSSSGDHFNILCILPALCLLAGAFFSTVIATSAAGLLPKYKDISKKLWFLPAALQLGSLVIALIVYIVLNFASKYWYAYAGYLSVKSVIMTIVLTGAYVLSMLWLAHPEGLPFGEKNASAGTAGSAQGFEGYNVVDKRYCGLIQHILLLSFTFGVWYYIWIYRMTKYTNGIEGEADRIPVRKLLLCMFVPFYIIYWYYKTAKRVDIMARNSDVPSEMAGVCLFCAIFAAVVTPIILQEKMNCIVIKSRN